MKSDAGGSKTVILRGILPRPQDVEQKSVGGVHPVNVLPWQMAVAGCMAVNQPERPRE